MGQIVKNHRTLFPGRGMSLVEVLIAVTILVLVIIGLSRVITGSDAHTGRIGHVARATRLLQQVLEECQNRPLSQYLALFPERTATGSRELEPAFFPNTETAIVAFRGEYQKSFQFFSRRVAARPVFNTLGQMREVWLEAEIRWTETRPEAGTASSPPRVLRAGGLITNLEVQ
ncbi:MAG TPA: hypothetical protein PKO06_06140 [Candidatus Ozemobacteraceae bacterium]|nr:hypothetical protein [Candidatus Ozemobacteraceae bacterium]